MGKPIRVLIVEDSENDALLLVEELKRSGYEPVFERVENAAAMRAALEKKEWDVILSDFSLPRFSAPEALDLMQKQGLDLPFIVISGTVGEDTAVEVMKKGADDFFTKDNITRLVPAVEREMADAEHRRKRRELEVRYAVLFEKAAEGIMGGDVVTKRLLFANPAMCRMLGYTEDEMKELSVPDIHPEEALERVIAEFEAQAKGDKTLAAELPFLRKDGSVFYADVNTVRVELEGRGVNVAFVTDITEQKVAADKIRHLNRVLLAIRGVNQLITREKDPAKLIADVSKHLVKTGGYVKVWIALFGEKGALRDLSCEALPGESSVWIRKTLEDGKRLSCQEKALEKRGLIVIEDTESACGGCPLGKSYKGNVVFCSPLICGEKVYGTMSVALPKDFAADTEEQKLFSELVGDVSFALGGIETGEKAEWMHKEREKQLHELEVFYESAMGREDRILELKKENEELKRRLAGKEGG